MKNPRKIELLSPAKNAEVGKEAILHGADAVYIGAPRFGARSAAANSVGDIAASVSYTHLECRCFIGQTMYFVYFDTGN